MRRLLVRRMCWNSGTVVRLAGVCQRAPPTGELLSQYTSGSQWSSGSRCSGGAGGRSDRAAVLGSQGPRLGAEGWGTTERQSGDAKPMLVRNQQASQAFGFYSPPRSAETNYGSCSASPADFAHSVAGSWRGQGSASRLYRALPGNTTCQASDW